MERNHQAHERWFGYYHPIARCSAAADQLTREEHPSSSACIGKLFRYRKSARQSFRDDEAPRLREAAHKLCGMIGAFSTQAAAVASDLEDQFASGQLEACRPLAAQLLTLGRQLLSQLDGMSMETLQRRLR